MISGPVFQVGAVMRLVDMISGPLRLVQSTMSQTERGATALSVRMAGLAKAMLPLVAAAGIVLGALGGTAFATVETGRALGELSSVGVRDLQTLEKAGREFSNYWAGTSTAQFVSAAYDIKSGISSLTDEGVADFTRMAALTGKATKSTVDEMTSLFAVGYGIYKGMYDEVSDMQFGELFSAGIAASVQNFKTTGGEMAGAISALGASAANANIPLEEQLSIMGMLQATMSGSEAGNRYRALVESAAQAGQRLGMSFVDANQQLLSMPEILNMLRSRYGDTLNAMEKMEIQKAFGTKEAVAVIDLLYGRVGDLTSSIHGMSGAMQMGTGFTARMAEAMNQDLGAVMEIARQRIRNLLEIIGQIFAPTILWVISLISGTVLVLQRLAATPVTRVILGLTAALAAAVLGVAAFVLVLSGAGAVAAIVMAKLAPVVGALAALSWPVWLAVGALAALYVAWQTNFGGMADTIQSFFGNVGLVFRAVREIFATLSGSAGYVSAALADELEAAGLLGLVTTLARVVFRVKALLGEMWSGFRFVTAGISDIFAPVFNSLRFALEPVLEILASVASALFGATSATDAGPWRALGAVIGITVGSAFRLLAWVVRLAMVPLQLFAYLIGSVVRVAQSVGEAIGWAVDMLFRLGDLNLFDSGVKLIETLVAGIKSRIMAPVDVVRGGLSKLRNLLPFSDAKEGPLSQLTLSGRRIMDTLGQGVQSAAPNLKNHLATALAGMTVLFPGIGGGPQEPASAARIEAVGSRQQQSAPSGGGSSSGASIYIEKLVLEGVAAPEDFVRKLQQLVESYDA